MTTYAMPRSPKSMTGGPLRAPGAIPIDPIVRAQPIAAVSPGSMTGRLGRGALQVQAQGRDVVNQGGQAGVVGRGGNFQPLGAAAIRRMRSPVGGTNLGGGGGAGAGTSEMDRPDLAGVLDSFNGRGAGGQPIMRPFPGQSPSPQALPGTDIETAIQSLKGQLGMPTDAQVAGGGASDEMMQKLSGMPAGGNWQQPTPQGQGAQNPNQNPYADILRRRMATYGGAAAALTGGQLAY